MGFFLGHLGKDNILKSNGKYLANLSKNINPSPALKQCIIKCHLPGSSDASRC